jgi:hypothetical protein
VAIPLASLTSESAPAALSEGDQQLIADLRQTEEAAIEEGTLAAGGGKKGKRAEYRCVACGYGIIVYGQAPSYPICRETRWEHAAWRPFSQLLDDVVLPFGTRSQRGRLHPPSSPTAEHLS